MMGKRFEWCGDGIDMWDNQKEERIDSIDFEEAFNELSNERDRYKKLSEIRQEIINNYILTIKEFIDNCSDKKVKKTLEQLFYSEVNEYDLSKKIRKLEKENEQLKSFKDRVFNLFEKEIKEENELLDYYLKEKVSYNADRQQIIIGVLKRLQKELEE